MTLRQRICYVWLPIIGIPVYFLILLYLPEPWSRAFVSERGAIELGTAVFFLLAAGVSLWHCHHHRARLPRPYCLWYYAFAAGALFIAMEEVSYGQHLTGFESPAWFAAFNEQQELNLHNLAGNKLSGLLRNAGSIAVPVLFVLLPLLYRSRPEFWQRPHWSFYLLPKSQLIALAVVAQAVTLPAKLPDSLDPYYMTFRLGEVKELYWSVAALLYVCIMYWRQQQSAIEQNVLKYPGPTQAMPTAERRAA